MSRTMPFKQHAVVLTNGSAFNSSQGLEILDEEFILLRDGLLGLSFVSLSSCVQCIYVLSSCNSNMRQNGTTAKLKEKTVLN